MAFKELSALDSDVTISLGGISKKTGKANPTKVEGYFIGSREVASQKSKTGKAAIHFFQTANGNIGVWGKTDLDRKMGAVTLGTLVRVTQNGMKKIPGKNDMYSFKVEVDTENTIEVTQPEQSSFTDNSDDSAYNATIDESDMVDQDVEADEVQPDEIKPARPQAPRTTPKAASAESLVRINKLLGR